MQPIDTKVGDKIVPFRNPKIHSKKQNSPIQSFDKQAIIESLQKPYYLFDFKEWAELSKKDPELFEQRRKQVIGEFIDQCRENNKKRIAGLQWRIEQERRLSSSSMGTCIRLYNMMWEQVLGDNGMLENLKTLSNRSLG